MLCEKSGELGHHRGRRWWDCASAFGTLWRDNGTLRLSSADNTLGSVGFLAP